MITNDALPWIDNDVALPDRPNSEDGLYFDKQHHISHERELIGEVKKTAAEVGSLKASGGYRKLGASDRRVQQWKSRIAGIIQDAHRTGLSRRGEGRWALPNGRSTCEVSPR